MQLRNGRSLEANIQIFYLASGPRSVAVRRQGAKVKRVYGTQDGYWKALLGGGLSFFFQDALLWTMLLLLPCQFPSVDPNHGNSKQLLSHEMHSGRVPGTFVWGLWLRYGRRHKKEMVPEVGSSVKPPKNQPSLSSSDIRQNLLHLCSKRKVLKQPHRRTTLQHIKGRKRSTWQEKLLHILLTTNRMFKNDNCQSRAIKSTALVNSKPSCREVVGNANSMNCVFFQLCDILLRRLLFQIFLQHICQNGLATQSCIKSTPNVALSSKPREVLSVILSYWMHQQFTTPRWSCCLADLSLVEFCRISQVSLEWYPGKPVRPAFVIHSSKTEGITTTEHSQSCRHCAHQSR